MAAPRLTVPLFFLSGSGSADRTDVVRQSRDGRGAGRMRYCRIFNDMNHPSGPRLLICWGGDMERRTSPRRHHPVPFHGGLATIVSVMTTVAIWASLGWHWGWWPWLGAWLAGVNLTTLGYYGLDKFQARRLGGRVPEVVLHGLAVAGGSLGAVSGMRLFRHKTIKARFRLIFALIVLAQLGLIAAIAYRLLLHRTTTR